MTKKTQNRKEGKKKKSGSKRWKIENWKAIAE